MRISRCGDERARAWLAQRGRLFCAALPHRCRGRSRRHSRRTDGGHGVWRAGDQRRFAGGSRDEPPASLEEYAKKQPYILIIRRKDRGDPKLGGGVIEAFDEGFKSINPDEFDYVCKLDLDLDIPPGYFEALITRMEANPRIGTCSGKPYMDLNGRLVSEKCGDENSVGMIKFYRTACFKQIGGFVRELMWDGIDCHRCRMLGWIAVSWDDPTIRFTHLRPMGTSHKNWWTGRVRHGYGQYFMGTTPPYMVASCAFRVLHPPMLLGSMAMMWGYARSALTRATR